MRTIEQVTDDVLKQMRSSGEWGWDDWWTKIVRNGPIPKKNSLKYKQFIERRLRIKNQVNRELVSRNLPERLICVGWGKGIYLESNERIAKTFIEDRSRKIANAFTSAIVHLDELSRASKLPDEDRKLLLRVTSAFEFNQSALAGTFTRMRSLTATAKKQILLNFGVKL